MACLCRVPYEHAAQAKELTTYHFIGTIISPLVPQPVKCNSFAVLTRPLQVKVPAFFAGWGTIRCCTASEMAQLVSFFCTVKVCVVIVSTPLKFTVSEAAWHCWKACQKQFPATSALVPPDTVSLPPGLTPIVPHFCAAVVVGVVDDDDVGVADPVAPPPVPQPVAASANSKIKINVPSIVAKGRVL